MSDIQEAKCFEFTVKNFFWGGGWQKNYAPSPQDLFLYTLLVAVYTFKV